MTIKENNILFVGNPGVGKSALLNCLSGQAHFKSGTNIGSGISYKLDQIKINGTNYIDTPGLKDVKMRETAAKAITEALRKDGIYQVAFVVTLESGRVKAEDATTIKVILENVPEIKQFGIIINKLAPRSYKEISTNHATKMSIAKDLTGMANLNSNFILPMQKVGQLTDGENVVVSLPQLNTFVLKTLPGNEIHSVNVKAIPVADVNVRYQQEIEKQRLAIEKERQEQQRIEREAAENRRIQEQRIREQKQREANEQRRLAEERRRAESERLQRQREIQEANERAARQQREAEQKRLETERLQREQHERNMQAAAEQQRRNAAAINWAQANNGGGDDCVIL